MTRNRPIGLYCRYLDRLRQLNEARGQWAPELFDEQYWRDREYWRDQQNLNVAEAARDDVIKNKEER